MREFLGPSGELLAPGAGLFSRSVSPRIVRVRSKAAKKYDCESIFEFLTPGFGAPPPEGKRPRTLGGWVSVRPKEGYPPRWVSSCTDSMVAPTTGPSMVRPPLRPAPGFAASVSVRRRSSTTTAPGPRRLTVQEVALPFEPGHRRALGPSPWPWVGQHLGRICSCAQTLIWWVKEKKRIKSLASGIRYIRGFRRHRVH